MPRKPIEELTGSAKIAAMGEVNLRQASARKARERKAAKGARAEQSGLCPHGLNQFVCGGCTVEDTT